MFKLVTTLLAVMLVSAITVGAIAQGIVTNRNDFSRQLQGTQYDAQRASNFFYALRNRCDSERRDSVNNFNLGGSRSPVANINHTCARYTTCDGRVNVPGGRSFRFVLNCR